MLLQRTGLKPSPLRGEGWVWGLGGWSLLTRARHPHPTLPLKGEGL
jgi:hypothetical protein